MSIEERLAVLEKELQELKGQLQPAGKENWLAKVSGSFKNDPDFEEILRLGREIRKREDDTLGQVP